MNNEGFGLKLYINVDYCSLELESIYKESKKIFSDTIIYNEIVDLYHEKFRDRNTIYQEIFPVIRIHFMLKNDAIREYYYNVYYYLYDSKSGTNKIGGYMNWL